MAFFIVRERRIITGTVKETLSTKDRDWYLVSGDQGFKTFKELKSWLAANPTDKYGESFKYYLNAKTNQVSEL